MANHKPGAPALQAAPFDHPAWPSQGPVAEPESPESPNSGAATAAASLARALQYHRSGKIGQAAALYRQVLAADPENPDALHLLGVTMHQNGEHRTAAEHIERAIAIRPGEAAYHNNLGSTLNGCGETDKAAAAYEQAIELDPAYAEALVGLAGLRLARGDAAAALALAERALARQSANAEACRIMGCALAALDRLEEAAAQLEQALALAPELAEAQSDLGTVRRRQWRPDEALAHYREAVGLAPDSAIYRNNLGVMLADLGRAHEAIEEFEAGLAIDPGIAVLRCHYAMALTDTGRLAEATAHLEQALTLDPGLAMAHHALVPALVSLGRVDQALHHHDRGMALAPDDAARAGNRMFVRLHQDGADATELAAEFGEWGERYVRPLIDPAQTQTRSQTQTRTHDNDRDPDRRLRVGYLSPDFRAHTVAYYIEPLLAAHDREAVEIHCYAEIATGDETSRRFEALADGWCLTKGMSDEALAERIRGDRIDVLVDLAGHTAGNRQMALARRPAPVQVAHLVGLGQTTGSPAMDYVLTDPWVTPEGEEALFAEAVWRLDRPVLSFEPDPAWPGATPLPAAGRGHVTFASFNKPSRIGAAALALWTRVLEAVPGTRLLLLHPAYRAPETGERIADHFAASGLGDRVEIRPAEGGWAEAMDAYAEVDIALDSFPLCGGSTTCIALWMGLPVIVLAGQGPHRRLAESLLAAADFSEGVAPSEDHYVALAAAYAGDFEQLARLRAGLMDRVRSSPLLDHRGIARAVEAAYRGMWRRWCAGETPSPGGN